MKVYLAGPYAAREALARCAAELEKVGYTVRARWLDGTHEVVADEAAATPQDRERWAREDLQDVSAVDVLVAFTQAASGCPRDKGLSGGRHIETGYALALNKRVVLVGDPENVFHSLNGITKVADWHEALILLAAELVSHERNRPLEVAS